jgi:glucose-6-phosphate dehydrogenase assembly protein OpcA
VSIVQEAYSASRTITAINNASPGVPFTIIFTTGNVTIQNNASIKLAGGVDFVATASDSITLVWNGTALQEISRSVN